MKTEQEILEALSADLPAELVKQRSDGREQLSYLEGWVVYDRLNSVAGALGVDVEVTQQPVVLYTDIYQGRTGRMFEVGVQATVRVTIRDNAGRKAVREDSGFGNGQVGFDETEAGLPVRARGKAYELAIKEAVTDAMKRAAKGFGPALGLALYDKKQSRVSPSTEAATTPAADVVAKAKELLAGGDRAAVLSLVNSLSPAKRAEVLQALGQQKEGGGK